LLGDALGMSTNTAPSASKTSPLARKLAAPLAAPAMG
jgi:hypothetical protein